MKQRFRLTLILFNGGVVLLTGLIFFLYSFGIIIGQARERGFSDIGQIYADLTASGKSDSFQQIVLKQKKLIPARIIIVDEESRLLADSNQQEAEINGRYIDADITEARRQGSGGSTIRSSRSGDLLVSATEKKEWENGWIIISLVYHVDQERKLLFSFGLLFLLLLVLITILVLQLVQYTRRRIKRPLNTLVRHTREAAGGGFYKISFDSNDPEFNQLAEHFNSLIDRYDLLTEADNRKYSRINTLLSNLKTGILMVDSENTVTLVNPEAERLLNLNRLHLFHVREESGGSNEILEKILVQAEEVQKNGSGVSFSAETENEDIIEITVERMIDKYRPYNPGGALVILRDVTEMRRLEKLKDEFVSNVSHELRTPLTVISGFVETLKSWELLDEGDRSTALNIIEVETERLKKLISELLLLSRIEGEMGHARKKKINSAEAVGQITKTLFPLAAKKGIETSLAVEKELPPLDGISGWFRQIVYNLVDNAIKYTPEGGRIKIRLFRERDELILEVEDTGPGIPEEEKTKIFERFYRKDKSRNSKIQGSGIGLTITRHMIAEFGGRISIADGKTGGSIFRAALPLTGTPAEEIVHHGDE